MSRAKFPFRGEDAMQLHADWSQRVVLDTTALPWHASPEPGVERRLLDRDGDEVARATSLVRYAPGSRFGHHEHGGGEEIFVLEGTLSDEHGHYPAGTYLLNPPGSAHAPYSEEGCLLLVKLRHIDAAERERVVVDTAAGAWQGPADGLQRQPLFRSEATGVWAALARYAPGATLEHHGHPAGEELFVLAGELRDEHGVYPAGTWVRQPPGSDHAPWSDPGCTVLVIAGHLPG